MNVLHMDFSFRVPVIVGVILLGIGLGFMAKALWMTWREERANGT